MRIFTQKKTKNVYVRELLLEFFLPYWMMIGLSFSKYPFTCSKARDAELVSTKYIINI